MAVLKSFVVLVIKPSGLQRQAADGFGDLVAGALHLVVKPDKPSLLGVVRQHVQLLERRGEPLIARSQRLFKLTPLIEMNSLGIRRIVVGI